jgi:hypothetical protein
MARKMSDAEKRAMLWVYGKRVKAPADRTLDKLMQRGFVYETATGIVKLTAIGKNVAKMMAGDMKRRR